MPFLLLALALVQAPPLRPVPDFSANDGGVSDEDEDLPDETLPPSLKEPPVDTTADQMTADFGTQHTLLQGHARLFTRGVLLRADEVDYDPEHRAAQAHGNVVLTYGPFGASAEAVEIDLAHHFTVLHGATLYQKQRVSPDALAQVETANQLRLLGKNVLTLRADVIYRISAKHYRANTIWMTGCDCRTKDWLTEPPSWSVRGSNADIEPGNRLTLSMGRLLIKDVPTIPVPYLFLPLSDRQTGLLLPHPNYTSNNGFQLEEPFFWAINRWADATFDPGYFFGDNHGYKVNNPDYYNPDDNTGMRGPRLGYELRYIPSFDTHGVLTGALVYDTKYFPSDSSDHASNASDPVRGLRGDLSWIHDQKLGEGFSDHVELQGVSDQAYFRDVTPDVVGANTQFLRSDARIDHHSDSTEAYLAGSYYQDFNAPRPLASLGPMFGPNDVNALTFQRAPALGFIYEERKVGPFAVSLDTSAVRYAPLTEEQARASLCIPGVSSDGGIECPYATNREVSERVDVAPQVRLPITLGRFGEIAPYASVHEDGWLVEGNTTQERTYAEVGTTAQTELSRVFYGDGAVYRNVITPMGEIRAVPWARESMLSGNRSVLAGGGGPALANDEYDNALPTTQELFQTIVAVRTRIDRKVGKVLTTPFTAEIGQGYDLLGRRPADSYLNLGLTQGPASFNGQVRYDPVHHDVDSVNTSLSISDIAWYGRSLPLSINAGATPAPLPPGIGPTGSNLTLSYRRMAYGLADPQRATLAELVGSTAPPLLAVGAPFYQAEELDLSGVYKTPTGLGISGGMGFLPHVALSRLNSPGVNLALTQLATPAAGALITAPTRADQIEDSMLTYHLGVDYGSPCGCWGLHAAAVFQPTSPSAGLRLGSSFYSPASFVFSLEANRLAGPF